MRKKLLLFFLTICIGGIYAQSPGGIGSPELWFQTKSLSSNLNGEYRWVDYSGDSLRLNVYDTQGASAGEEYKTSTFRSYNGHPAISLDKLLDTKTREVMLKRTNLSQATIFGVFAPNINFNSEMLLYGLNGRGGQGIWLSTDKIYPSRESSKSVFDYGQSEGMDLMYSANDRETDVNKFREGSMRIVAYYRSIPPSTGIWGERDKAVISFGYYKSNNTNNTASFSIPVSANRQFTGYIPEFIAYNRLLNPLERRQVDSYLAVKYGLSLPVSYFGSKGQLLWDYDENTIYNNRITALYRDDASGLNQLESSTSYEEGPNYADLVTHDYYYLNNPGNRTSSSRLLVIGRQYGNNLSNDSYMFWGDNNASTNVYEIEGRLGMKMMDRRWLLKTNITNAPESERVLDWQVQDLNFSTSGYVTRLEKTTGLSAPETGYAYTQKPLKGSSGYIGIDYTSIYGDIYLKFGGQGFATAGGYDYGYYIASDYKVYPIVRGVVSETSLTTLVLTSRLEVEKHSNKIFLRIDGIRLTASEITLDPQDDNKAWYASLAFTKGVFSTNVNLRHGGFTDTGNRVELSYATNRASDFKDNNKGTSFLVIDRSGTGNFNTSDVVYIQADEIDILRQKVIFNNVFFDADANGSDVFTFAYNESDIAGEIDIIDPSCNASDGEVKIMLTSGTRAFKYTLTDTSSNTVIRSGRENSYTIHLTGLSAGDYQLKVEEAGGFNVEGSNSSGTPTRVKTTNFFPVFEGSLEWMVTNTTDTYMIGYTTFVEDVNNAKNIIHYGLKKQGNKLYKIVSGKLESTNVTVETGDVLTIAKTMNKVTYYKNGEQFSSNSIKILDYLLKFYGLIDMSEGPAEILNVNATGFFNLADYSWQSMNGISVKQSNNASLSYDFSLEDPCAEQPTPPQPEAQAQPDLLTLRYAQGSMMVQAQIEFEDPDVVSFVVYNLNGQLVKQVHLSVPQKIQIADIQLPNTGVYIIKAITVNNGEYTKKFFVQ
ncbi:hypothetical protein M2451_003810 [Dysgonomonas sp. PFB1-18]|uniref:T9SS type A sorting domain-containing protein n=1 Tax=unclassified Dysgonomonas TaxID=2630389 RepID=UPI002473BFDA|nr:MULTISPECIES: T9SS type A sorting domain-containing protein [unclassified Dysgonomonas]MDH6310946.1 hypothetical protein [Dysgonomonas sp. PF1-14]MDH6340839.1 hypothetical protein [Dysgonomonas sp. PF1-16]MDH6382469.1 hypothetical protein [Dysgonomonas sp. PFB1-18]MDH6399818.1 hypothetical protein [Dysgonomonas sp. PF1-23]